MFMSSEEVRAKGLLEAEKARRAKAKRSGDGKLTESLEALKEITKFDHADLMTVSQSLNSLDKKHILKYSSALAKAIHNKSTGDLVANTSIFAESNLKFTTQISKDSLEQIQAIRALTKSSESDEDIIGRAINLLYNSSIDTD